MVDQRVIPALDWAKDLNEVSVGWRTTFFLRRVNACIAYGAEMSRERHVDIPVERTG